MKYQFFGPKIPHVGKPLWEILGNLKNFGVGRYILRSTLLKYPEPSFFKVLKVQPLPPPADKFEDRNVIVWVEEIYRGRVVEEVLCHENNFYPDYMLIPKVEEENYLKLQKECAKNLKLEIIPKYCSWPPLYKLLWEDRYFRENKQFQKIPNLKTIFPTNYMSLAKIEDKETTRPPDSCNLYKEAISVEEMIKEIVKLQKVADLHSNKENT